MNKKLLALPIEQLAKLKADIDKVFEARRYEMFRVGRLATFETTKRGGGVKTIRITKIGPTNINGEEVNERGNPTGMKWRIHPQFLTPVFEAPKPVAPLKGAGKDAPSGPMMGTF